jgi:hypothetical protein
MAAEQVLPAFVKERIRRFTIEKCLEFARRDWREHDHASVLGGQTNNRFRD